MFSLLVRVCLVATLFRNSFCVLPDYIKPCRRGDPELDRCITDTIDSLRDKLSEGIPELEAPSIEPLVLKQIRLVRGPVGARLDVNLTNLQVSGPSTFVVTNLKSNLDDGVTFTFKVSFDKLTFKGKYSINTRLLILRLSGSGDITGSFNGYNSDVILRAHKVQRNNDVYLNFEQMKIKIKVGSSNIHLSNLFGGDPVLGAASNDILNANSGYFLDEIRPVLETALAELFTDVANKITRSFTYEELFPV